MNASVKFVAVQDFGADLVGRLPDFLALTKPRISALAVFTALVGMWLAPGTMDPLIASIAVLAIAAGAGAAGALNMWYDSDIDALMQRTSMRPIPSGRVSPREALTFGLALAGLAVVTLGAATNVTAAALLAGAIAFYAVVYTMWLKRSTSLNIVIGGAAGALPPAIGWAAGGGGVSLEPLVLFLIIFLWTPPHFWALALKRANDYVRAGVPMLPVVAGQSATKRQILLYSALLVPVTLLPCVLGFAGLLYGAAAVKGGVTFIGLAWKAPHRLFGYSILYLFVLFATLLAGSL
jgi:protoheme IX farnesyltransferase